MPPAANDHSTSKGNNKNRLLKFDIPILPGNNYGLTIYKNSLRIIATLRSNKICITNDFRLPFFKIAFTDKQTVRERRSPLLHLKELTQ